MKQIEDWKGVLTEEEKTILEELIFSYRNDELAFEKVFSGFESLLATKIKKAIDRAVEEAWKGSREDYFTDGKSQSYEEIVKDLYSEFNITNKEEEK